VSTQIPAAGAGGPPPLPGAAPPPLSERSMIPEAGERPAEAVAAPASAVRSGPNGERQFPCAQCGAWLRFDPAVEQLKCDHCGYVNPVPQLGEAVAEQDYNAALAATRDTQETQTLETVRCSSCAAEFTLDPNIESGACPFCGSAVVREITRAEQLKPKGVLPFKVTIEEAGEQFRAWLKRLWFAPNKLKQYARTDRSLLTGMYTPYWTFDSATSSQYTGERGDNYTVYVTRTVTRDGKTTTEQVPETRVRWTSVSGHVSRDFDDVLVLASSSLPERITEKLEPWDLPALKPYAEEYLSGFRTERYQVDLPGGFARARAKMDLVIRGDIRSDIGGDQQRIHSVDTRHDRVTYKHVLLPVWLAAYQYQKKTYRFVVNGRTGEVQGERPWSWLKIAGVVAGVIVAGIAVYLLVHGIGSDAPRLPK
jgi:DNA-directed RNA polymerase subunit RPC12/RpoP